MNLSAFRANVDFSQSSLSIEGIPMPRPIGRGNIGMAMLFERRVRTRGASSAATEMRKTFGGPEGAKSTLSEKRRQIHLEGSQQEEYMQSDC
ncbi:MAG: hypothetical protein PHO70_07700 [Candidatus Omnitrophica bacterium]|nr:hypothetical protein [Candidatus Omnitrophota bacterium]